LPRVAGATSGSRREKGEEVLVEAVGGVGGLLMAEQEQSISRSFIMKDTGID
jgi:hypothetical protein